MPMEPFLSSIHYIARASKIAAIVLSISLLFFPLFTVSDSLFLTYERQYSYPLNYSYEAHSPFPVFSIELPSNFSSASSHPSYALSYYNGRIYFLHSFYIYAFDISSKVMQRRPLFPSDALLFGIDYSLSDTIITDIIPKSIVVDHNLIYAFFLLFLHSVYIYSSKGTLVYELVPIFCFSVFDLNLNLISYLFFPSFLLSQALLCTGCCIILSTDFKCCVLNNTVFIFPEGFFETLASDLLLYPVIMIKTYADTPNFQVNILNISYPYLALYAGIMMVKEPPGYIKYYALVKPASPIHLGDKVFLPFYNSLLLKSTTGSILHNVVLEITSSSHGKFNVKFVHKEVLSGTGRFLIHNEHVFSIYDSHLILYDSNLNIINRVKLNVTRHGCLYAFEVYNDSLYVADERNLMRFYICNGSLRWKTRVLPGVAMSRPLYVLSPIFEVALYNGLIYAVISSPAFEGIAVIDCTKGKVLNYVKLPNISEASIAEGYIFTILSLSLLPRYNYDIFCVFDISTLS